MTVSDSDMTTTFDLLNEGRHEDALTFCNRLVAADPTDAGAYSLRGHVWARRGNYDEACQDRNMHVALTPAHAKDLAHYLRGRLHKDFQAYHKAIADFTTAMESDDEYVRGISRMQRADCHRLLGDFDRAEADCQAIPASFRYHGFYGATPGTRDLLLGDIREDRAKQLG